MTAATPTAATPTSVDTVRTVCSYCGVGCGIVLDVGTDVDGRRIAVRSSGDRTHPANRGRLCTKGVTSADMLAAGGRMTSGLVRDDRDAEPTACSTDEAIARAARGLRRILDEHGPDAIALYVSGQMTMEAQYLANKLAKGFIGTNQIESNSRLCMASAGVGFKQSLGADAPPGSYDDLDHADVFLVIGSNMADCHPILFLRMLDRMRQGAKLIVVDPRRTATADAGRPVPADPSGHRPRAAQRAAPPARRGRGRRRGVHRCTHRRLGRDGRAPGRLDAGRRRRDDRARARGPPPRRRADRWRGELGDVLDDGPQPERAGHVEHERDLQPAPGHRRDLPDRQRPAVVDRPAERDGRAGDGVHGTGPAGPTLGAGRGGSSLRRGSLVAAGGHAAHLARRRHRGPVHADGRRRGEGLLDHVHQPHRLGGQPWHGDRRPGGGRAGHHAGCVRRHRDQRLRRHRPPGGDVGGGRRRDGQLRAHARARADAPSTRRRVRSPTGR